MQGWTQIEEVYSPVGEGACRSLYVRAANGSEYIAKGPSLIDNFRHVAADEIIAASLAERIGLPVLDHRILTMGGELFFGSVWMDTSTFHPVIDENLLEKCDNREMIYEMAVFDTWICNTDRHERNLLVRCGGKPFTEKRTLTCPAERHTLLLNDHSDCLLPDNRTPSYFESSLSKRRVEECVTLPFVRRAIVSPDRLNAAIGLAESIGDADLAGIVQRVPCELLDEGDRSDWVGFLVSRRNSLREVIRNGKAFFSCLKGEI